ncbi:hypothetical protein fugu_007125 [Takifugu bimaculatus]|uniref:LRRCT domain-containing protein n=1 Tax=Takifugu bimaculatus TaxID=433685 RepID=A0A4Z2B4H6_9TELE|nr:hypothetical protein fugu_007125 [Takifugu bimaculatus]
MLWASVVAVLVLAATSRARSTAPPCRCSPLPPAGLKVDCSFSNLTELFGLPPDTTELLMQENRLTSVTPGLFDKLVGLEKVSLSGNPFHCDCKIQYLRNWLLKNMALVSQQPTCASPGSVARTEISDLSDDYFTSCGKANSTCGLFNIVIAVAVCFLIALLAYILRLAKMSTITLYIHKKHSELDAVALQPLRPKRRRRVNSRFSMDSQNSDSLLYVDDLEKPLLNLELLPQVLDTLQRRHNIKITVPEERRYAV